MIVFLLVVSCHEAGQERKSVDRTEILPENGLAELVFDTLVNDIGRISQGEQVIAWFDYVNNGEVDLVINQIKAGCGCTIPEWDRKPTPPGEKSSIKVVFNSSGKHGFQNINIAVMSNAEEPTINLKLRAIVE